MKMKVIFSPYCNLATSGFSEMKLQACQYFSCHEVSRRSRTYVKILLLIVKGSGTMRREKTTISATRRRKT